MRKKLLRCKKTDLKQKSEVFDQLNKLEKKIAHRHTVMKIIGIVQDKLHCGTTLFLTVEMLMKIFFYLLALS